MLISVAHAASEAAAAAPQDAGEAFLWNMGLIVVFVLLFYVLMIMPQQKRFKEHKAMLDSLKKGDSVVTGGGLIGKIDKIVSDSEVIVDLGTIKVTAVRSTLQSNETPLLKPDPKAKDKESGDAKPAAKAKTKPKKSV
jgi:preprotein translocase subunit YajC